MIVAINIIVHVHVAAHGASLYDTIHNLNIPHYSNVKIIVNTLV